MSNTHGLMHLPPLSHTMLIQKPFETCDFRQGIIIYLPSAFQAQSAVKLICDLIFSFHGYFRLLCLDLQSSLTNQFQQKLFFCMKKLFNYSIFSNKY